ncbi:hypothetical protein PHISP_02306 [Aspergillus sp. HF37]|nr:hypothetical protein PHISP_02306 [Aspergillus sp. HF37]
MASGVFNHHFTAANGFLVAPKQDRNNLSEDFTILRIQRLFPGDRGFVDHTVSGAKKADDGLETSMQQLETALEEANTPFGRCWAIMVHGPRFIFYEYHRTLEENHRLVPWGPPDQPWQNTFHARSDAAAIEWMLLHMAHTNTPPAR